MSMSKIVPIGKPDLARFAPCVATATSAIRATPHVANLKNFAFDDGQGLSEHTAPFDALVQVVEGETEIVISGLPHRLQGGEMILMPACHLLGLLLVGHHHPRSSRNCKIPLTSRNRDNITK